jgi:hypothetical protein
VPFPDLSERALRPADWSGIGIDKSISGILHFSLFFARSNQHDLAAIFF